MVFMAVLLLVSFGVAISKRRNRTDGFANKRAKDRPAQRPGAESRSLRRTL